MWYQLRRLGLKSLMRAVAVLYAGVGLVYLPFILVMTVIPNEETGRPLGLGLALTVWLAMLVFLPLLGAIFAGIFGWLYNWAAVRFGGVDFWLKPYEANRTG